VTEGRALAAGGSERRRRGKQPKKGGASQVWQGAGEGFGVLFDFLLFVI